MPRSSIVIKDETFLPTLSRPHFDGGSLAGIGNIWRRQLQDLLSNHNVHKTCTDIFVGCLLHGKLSSPSSEGHSVHDMEVKSCRGIQCPSSGLSRPRTAGLADLRQMLAARVELFPEELDRPEVRMLQVSQFWWFSGYRIAGGVGATPQQDRFALFTTTAHVQVHTMRRGITLDSLVAEVHRRPSMPFRLLLPDGRNFIAVPYQVPGPDFIQGSALPQVNMPPEPAQEEAVPDATAMMQLGQRVQPVASTVGHADKPTKAGPGPDTPFLRLPFTPGNCDCVEAIAPKFTPPELPEASHPPALLWHNFRAIAAKSGREEATLSPDIIPHYFTAATHSNQAAIDFSWGGIAGTTNAAFTVFDVLRHALVRPRQPDAKLQDIVEAAVAEAPFVVRAVQVLTHNVPGFPRPQLVLHRREDDPRAYPIPWDLRSVGGRIRVSLHFPGELFAASAASVQAVCPELPTLHEQLLLHKFVALDATGFLGANMPEDLEEVQFITVERSARAWFAENTQVAAELPSWDFLGPTSTSTTTQIQEEQRRFRFIVRHGFAQAQVEVRAPCLQADAILESLLMDVFARTTPIYGGVHVMLAKAQPLPEQGVQEVLFLVCGAADSEQAIVIADQRACGFQVSTLALAPFARCEFTVPEPWCSQGMHLFVNAAPVHLVQRPATQGDVFQFSTELDYPVALPTTIILNELPILEAYAWPLQAGERPFQLELTNTARLRRRQQCFWKHQEGLAEVLGPCHGPVRFRTEEALVPDLRDVQSGLARIPDCPARGLHIAETQAIKPCRATFASGCLHSSLHTALLPHFGHMQHFIVIMISHAAQTFGKLPLPNNCLLRHPGRPWKTGDIVDVLDLPACAVPYIPHLLANAPIPRPPRPRIRVDLDAYAEAQRRWRERGIPIPQADIEMILTFLRAFELEDAAAAADSASASGQPSSSGNDEGHSLLQVDMSIRKAAIPTPNGRRNIPVVRALTPPATRPSGDGSLPCDPNPKAHNLSCAVTTLQLQSLLPPVELREGPGRLLLGVDAEMFTFLFSHFNLKLFCSDWASLPGLKAATRSFLTGLPQLTESQTPEAIQYYVDGSFFADSGECGWAIVALGLHEGLWKWIGYVTVQASPDGSHHTLGAPVHSAFETELAAMAYTMAFCIGVPIPSAIYFDSTSAQAVAIGDCHDQVGSDLAQASRSLYHLLLLLKRRPAWQHIRSHTDHPINDLADSAAKAGAKGECIADISPCLYEAQQSAALPWLWTSLCLHPDVPAPCSNGALPDAAQVSKTESTVLQMRPDCKVSTASMRFRFRAVSYNCLTLQSIAQQESLCKQFYDRSTHVIGLQETRTSASGRSDNEHFYILHSPAHEGQLGCQLWLAKSRPVAVAEGSPVFWDSSSLCIIQAEPRVLLAVAKAGNQTFAFIVAHSPTSAAGAAACEAWWDSLTQAVRRMPCNSIPILLIDANAHNHDPEAHRVLMSGVSYNQKRFAEVIEAHDLRASGYVYEDGVPFHTWLGPGGQLACIDYVCCPASLSSGMRVEGPMTSFVGHVKHDHRPIAVTFTWDQTGKIRGRPARINSEGLHTPSGQLALKQLYQSMPPIPWHTSVDDHLRIINDHLHKGLQRICPKLADKPRDPVTSDHTWQLIKDRRNLRRHMHRIVARDEWGEYLNLLGEQVRVLSRQIRSAAKADAASSLRRSFAAARAQGTEALHRLCRRITKAGRRYRAPSLCPAIRNDQGQVVEDSFQILGEHFAEAERAAPVEPQEIVTRDASYAEQDFEVATCLSVAGLARAFSGLTTRRAAGWTALPVEAYQAAPVEAAHQHIALLLKCQLRRQCPIVWRGGLAAAIPKPSKPPHCTSGWRSILLLEAGAKGIARALRQDLLRAFETVRQPAQGDSRPGNPLQVASAHVRGLVKRIRATKKCGGVLFVDGQAAFYSLLREALLGSDSCSPPEFFRKLADEVFTTEDARLHFLVQALGPGLLQESGVPIAVRRFISASLDNTWYGIGASPTHFFQTRSGTVPGAPLADLLFQLVFGQVLNRVTEEAELHGVRPHLHSNGQTACCPLPAPSWMDDVAFPLISDAPTQLLQQAATLVQIVEAAFSEAGVRLNFSRGKTEFLPVIAGKHSQQLRKQWLCSATPTFAAQISTGLVHVHLTEQYTHLGSELDASGLDTVDI